MNNRIETKVPEESGSSRIRFLLLALMVCLVWFVLAYFSGVPAFMLKIEQSSQEGQWLGHWVKFVGGLIFITGLLPLILSKETKNYFSYLSGIGLSIPVKKQERWSLLVFFLVAGGLLGLDLIQNGVSGLAEFYASNGINSLELAFFSGLQAGVIEELFFRGAAFDLLRRRYPVWMAIVIPAVLFGFAHIWWGPSRVMVTALMGIFFALLRWRSNSIWGPILMHFLVNMGFPIPVWLGWAAALLVSFGLSIKKKPQTETQIG